MSWLRAALSRVFRAPPPQLALAGVGPYLPAPARAPPAAVLPLEHLWLAVPKSKVSASKKRIRNANRTPKLLKNWHMCKVCNKPKLMHRMCDEMRCFENEERRPRGGAAAARAPDAHAVEREAD